MAIGRIDGSETYGTLKGSSEGASVDYSQLVGEWHNAQGETIKITEDGKFYGKTLQGEESGITLRSVTSNFSAYQSYQVGASGFYYDPNQDAIILYSHSEYMPQPGHQLYYNRVVSRENTLPSSSVQDIKKVPAKPFSGPNPYKADLIKSIRFSTRNGEVTPTYYALYDVDDNGTAELLLGHDNEGETSVLGVYAMISGKPEQVIAIQDNMVEAGTKRFRAFKISYNYLLKKPKNQKIRTKEEFCFLEILLCSFSILGFGLLFQPPVHRWARGYRRAVGCHLCLASRQFRCG